MEFNFSSCGFEIILVDDFSTDGTRTWLQNISGHNIHVHLNDRNRGRGFAVRTGMGLSRGNVVGFMDIDCEISEAYIPAFAYAVENGADLALGARIYRVTMEPYVLSRHLLSMGYKFLIRRVMANTTQDSEAGYKFFSRRFTDYVVKHSKFDGWFWDTEVTLLAEYFHLNVAELPVAFLRNPVKTSTVKVFSDTLSYLRSIAIFRKSFKAGHYPILDQKNKNPQAANF